MIYVIKVRQIKVDIVNKSLEEIKRKTAQKLKINISDILDFKIVKESIDARKKENIHYSYEVNVCVKNENEVLRRVKSNDVEKTTEEKYKFVACGDKKLNYRPVIVGSGPAGLFVSYLLAENGYRPLIIERGEKVEDRVKSVEDFWKSGILNSESNVSFGEGGAGTFSDGKLNTLINDKENRIRKVFEIFVECGANSEILYVQKPHIGTDVLRTVVINMRNKIVEMGGEFRYSTKLTDIEIENNKINSVIVNGKEKIYCDVLVLAIGHSARDTFKMLYEKNISMKAKPFAVGVRVQHPQKMINESQYKEFSDVLPNASYKLTYTTKKQRGVYSFCMCPGGYVVNASSEDGMLAVNGMSNYNRESENANSAIVVTVSPDDFGNDPMNGIEYQRNLEKLAFEKGKRNIPVQLLKDFYDEKVSFDFGEVKPVFKGGFTFTDLNEVLPLYVSESLKEAFLYFDTKIKGFGRSDAILAGVESRTSSPIRIERDENFNSNVEGIYPCGEGAGYAGGITSAAVDGIKVAEKIAELYKNNI